MQGHATASARVRLVTPIRAAIYVRVSSDQQAERHTIDSQVEALLARAAENGHEIQAELRFLDDGQSGASLIRPALERLRDLAAMVAAHRLGLRARARPPGPLVCAPSGD
jgi:site-specific DNA recombinase